jgi:spermidine synthase
MKKLLRKYFPDFFPAERIHTPYNYLEVNKLEGHWVLDSKHVNYSYGTLHTVFREALQVFVPDLSAINEVLILGFGAGSVAHILQKERHFQGHITGVEIDETVLSLAQQYFQLDQLQNLTLYTSDAAGFVEQADRTFDLIVIDLFVDDLIPEIFENEIFLLQVKELLTPGGKLLYNRMNYHPKDQQKTEAFATVFHHAFADCDSTEEKSIQLKNKIFFAQK